MHLQWNNYLLSIFIFPIYSTKQKNYGPFNKLWTSKNYKISVAQLKFSMAHFVHRLGNTALYQIIHNKILNIVYLQIYDNLNQNTGKNKKKTKLQTICYLDYSIEIQYIICRLIMFILILIKVNRFINRLVNQQGEWKYVRNNTIKGGGGSDRGRSRGKRRHPKNSSPNHFQDDTRKHAVELVFFHLKLSFIWKS